MPPYTHLRWERAPEGWELWGVDGGSAWEPIELLAWVYQNHAKGNWQAMVYQVEPRDLVVDMTQEFPSLEEAQAWCWACVRTS